MAGKASEGADGLRPEDLRDAYFPGEQPDVPASEAPQTIALVDAYNDYEAEKDLQVYDEEFGLPTLPRCTAGQRSDCFEQVNQNGESALTKPPFPSGEEQLVQTENTCLSELAKADRDHTKISQTGEQDCLEAIEAGGWAVEISTDIEVAHAVCQNCKIVLTEASSAEYKDLDAAEETAAVKLGATEISNSWGGPEEGSDHHVFEHPGTVITAAAGDDGYLNWTEAAEAKEAEEQGYETSYFIGADYPASSPSVVAVGGTKLIIGDGTRQSETVWNEDPDPEGKNEGAGGGGCSEEFAAPPWQQSVPDWSQVGCGSKRAVADIAADADPHTGVAVYDSVPDLREENVLGAHGNKEKEIVRTPLGWWPIGGTSVASPIVASMFALAGGAHEVAYPAATLYSHLETTGLYNVTKGGNGKCDDDYFGSCTGSTNPLSPLDCGEGALICNAAPGCENRYYDGPTGVGTPNGIAAFKPGTLPAIVKPKCEPKSQPSEEKSKAQDNGSGGEAESSNSDSTGSSTDGNEQTQEGSPGTKSSSHDAVKQAARISALTLTANALAALRHREPPVAQLAFSCTLSQADRVRVTLSIAVRSDGHTHWHPLPASFTFNAVKGPNRRRLHGTGDLAAGTYRLALTPTGGTTRSITLRVA